MALKKRKYESFIFQNQIYIGKKKILREVESLTSDSMTPPLTLNQQHHVFLILDGFHPLQEKNPIPFVLIAIFTFGVITYPRALM